MKAGSDCCRLPFTDLSLPAAGEISVDAARRGSFIRTGRTKSTTEGFSCRKRCFWFLPRPALGKSNTAAHRGWPQGVAARTLAPLRGAVSCYRLVQAKNILLDDCSDRPKVHPNRPDFPFFSFFYSKLFPFVFCGWRDAETLRLLWQRSAIYAAENGKYWLQVLISLRDETTSHLSCDTKTKIVTTLCDLVERWVSGTRPDQQRFMLCHGF